MRLLALVDSPDHVCCRYRIRAFESALKSAGWSLTCEKLARGLFSRTAQLRRASRFDSVILQRKLLPPWQLAILRRQARRLVFDFDDAVLFRDSYDRRGPHSAGRLRRFQATVRRADAVIAGNDFLADCALRAGAPAQRVHLIPTCIDPELYGEPPAPALPGESGEGQVQLVWIGSGSTLQGLEDQRELWDLLGEEVPGLKLRVICDRFPNLRKLPVIAVPWSQEWEARDLAAGQIGISWLPDDLWSRGKCGLKVLQYQAAGLPVVANPVGMHNELIEPGVTGFLPSTPEQWVAAVRGLAADARRRRQMGRTARERVAAGFSTAVWGDSFAVAAAGGEAEEPEKPRPAAAAASASSSSSSARAIPDPFFIRMRRMRVPGRAGSAGRLDGTGNHD